MARTAFTSDISRSDQTTHCFFTRLPSHSIHGVLIEIGHTSSRCKQAKRNMQSSLHVEVSHVGGRFFPSCTSCTISPVKRPSSVQKARTKQLQSSRSYFQTLAVHALYVCGELLTAILSRHSPFSLFNDRFRTSSTTRFQSSAGSMPTHHVHESRMKLRSKVQVQCS